jgi:hypothetical protein
MHCLGLISFVEPTESPQVIQKAAGEFLPDKGGIKIRSFPVELQ